jgi:predicted nucleic-acid-binding protein
VIGLDTNVLVRYIAQDDLGQSAAATTLIEAFTAEDPGFISMVTLVETMWVLARAYETTKPALLAVLEGILRARELVVEEAETHYRALGLFAETTLDYADAVIIQAGRRAACEATVTFDKRAVSGGMRLLELRP